MELISVPYNDEQGDRWVFMWGSHECTPHENFMLWLSGICTRLSPSLGSGN